MDIYVSNIPIQATKNEIDKFFREALATCGITIFHADKFRNKPSAILTVSDKDCGERFLALYGIPPHAHGSVRAVKGLSWNRKFVRCSRSNRDPSVQALECLKHEAAQRASKLSTTKSLTSHPQQNKPITRFAIRQLECGVWDYLASQLAFTSYFLDHRRVGAVTFGLKSGVILLGGPESEPCRIDFNYHDCENIIIGGYSEPTVSFTLRIPPRFYTFQTGEDGEDLLSSALMSLTIGSSAPRLSDLKKVRLPSINDAHSKVAGSCFVYRVTLADYKMVADIKSLLGRNVKAPSVIPMSTPTSTPRETLEQSFVRLNYELTDDRRYGKLPFPLLYQISRLAWNGVLSPVKVRHLLPAISKLENGYSLDATLSAIRRFYFKVPYAGPDTDPDSLSVAALKILFEDLAAAYRQSQEYGSNDPYALVKKHTHINLIHKIVVTPAGTYLEGPEPEPTNRVLRLYPHQTDFFARVVFQDEDGASVRYDPRASQDHIYHGRFKGVLDTSIIIAGRAFSFLGFSHSSLRSQSCWFMAPLFLGGSLRLPEHILKMLGDFFNIRVPAKCAARIGQNFTDTNASVDLKPHQVHSLEEVVRNGYDFSDGVGTISAELLQRVWRVYGTRRLLKPTALQIRFQGAKGMVSLDSRLPGQQLKLRANMKKFETANAWNLEICGAAFKPLPLVLNRQFIKILEDLGIPQSVFLELQKTAVDRLRLMTASSINTATFLEEMDCARATRMPSLIRLLDRIGLDYHSDDFLYGVVEMAVITKLRDIKYRGRIPVDKGYTLYGIMDETGYLKEGEVYVVTEKPPEGGRKVLVQDRVVVTRSPAMHPGDIQIVSAVEVPEDSRLNELSNVVVFSQHGHRDLPGCLSGGDLDGDLYNILYDERLIPAFSYPPAEYPKISAVELDRPVTRKDMSDFFIQFMESDLLGMLSNLHQQLADQHEVGTYHNDCLKLAQMASTAVDFSKTGLPVDMRQCPRYNKFRPDFMAQSPRVFVSEGGQLDVENNDDEEDEAFEGMDAERRGFRYYPSQKVLGHLYREIDERIFLETMQEDHRTRVSKGIARKDILRVLVTYMKKLAAVYGIAFRHHRQLAVEIRASYEENLMDILHYYAPSAHMPLSEHEAFAGTILGRVGGAQGKPLRELSKTMRERFEAVAEYTIMRIVKGDEQMRGVSDLDLLYDESVDREVEALPRAIACLVVAVEQAGAYDRKLGKMKSFGYIAAGVCLKELERFWITTFGSHALPWVGS